MNIIDHHWNKEITQTHNSGNVFLWTPLKIHKTKHSKTIVKYLPIFPSSEKSIVIVYSNK
jgi:hypothetical protein